MEREPTIHDVMRMQQDTLEAIAVFSASVDRRFDRLENRVDVIERTMVTMQETMVTMQGAMVTKDYMEGRLAAFSR